MFSRMGSAAFKKDLTNTRILCEYLDNPHEKFKSIHVAGTNGKGSVSHMLASIFQGSGYKTGLYTSPHLYDFRERIRMNGEMVDEGFVVSFVEKIRTLAEEIQPSFFEITVAMAFAWFAEQKVDMAIVEVGLGGRLDSTNIISPELSIITNIGWDHMNMLGNSLEEIAFEKAGIIKKNTPVVIGERKQESDPVFMQVARQNDAPLYFAQDSFAVEDFQLEKDSISVAVLDKKKDQIRKYELDLPGIYQAKNILAVLQAVELLTDYRPDEELIRAALKNTKKNTGLHGRWEIIQHQPTVVLEVAHNKDGIEQMLAHMSKIAYNKLHLIIGMVKDKEIEGVLKLLPPAAQYYFAQANIPRALEAKMLASKAAEFSLRGETYADVNIALQEALHKASIDDLIVVCGSIFLVAEVQRRNYTN